MSNKLVVSLLERALKLTKKSSVKFTVSHVSTDNSIKLTNFLVILERAQMEQSQAIKVL